MSNKFGPKKEDHHSVGEKCPVCHLPFKEGDHTTLVSIGVDDEENKRLMHEGKAFNSIALEIHWDCRIINDDDIE